MLKKYFNIQSFILLFLSILIIPVYSYSDTMMEFLNPNLKMKVIPGNKPPAQIRSALGHGIPGKDYVPDEVIVRYWDNVSKTKASSMANKYGLTVKKSGKHINYQLMKIPSGKSVDDMIETLKKDPNVKYVEPNYRVYASYFPNDPYFFDTAYLDTGGIDPLENLTIFGYPGNDTAYFYYSYQPFMYPGPVINGLGAGGGIPHLLGEPGLFMVDIPGNMPSEHLLVPGTWSYEKGSSKIKVAVIDTGVDLDHEDLKGKLLRGFDYVDNDSIPQDQNGHGTHVAGIIAAVPDNHKGIIGMAPNVRIIPIRVLGADGSGTSADVAEGITGAARDYKAHIINMSLGGIVPGYAAVPLIEMEAVNFAKNEGVIIIAAAGNESLNFSAPGTTEWAFPAMYAGVLSVGSWDYRSFSGQDTAPDFVSYTNRGYYGIDPMGFGDDDIPGDVRGVDVYAPGGSDYFQIVSLQPYNASVSTPTSDRYVSNQGTSMASPHAAGLAALLYNRGIQDRRSMLYAFYSTSFSPYIPFYHGHFEPAGDQGGPPNFTYGMIDPFYAIFSYQPTINLAYSSNVIDDSIVGDSNGILDPGETVDMQVNIENTGSNSALDIGAVLTTNDPNVTILQNYSFYPDIQSGAIESNISPYRFSLNNIDIGNGYIVRFLLNMTFSSGTGDSHFVILPFDIEVSQTNVFVSSNSLYHEIHTNPSVYSSLIDDNDDDDRTETDIPDRDPEEDGEWEDNIIDNYLNPGETVEIAPILINNLGTNLFATWTTPDQTRSGAYGNLKVYNDYPSELMGGISDSFELYITGTTTITIGTTSFDAGYVAGSAITEHDYNFSVAPAPSPPPPEEAKGRGIRNHIPDEGYGQVIFEADLHTSSDPTAIWIDRFPITYAVETSLAFDHYEITDQNEDRIVQPGETIRLKAFIRNSSNLPTIPDADIIANIAVEPPYDSFVTITIPSNTYSALGPKELAGPQGSGYEITLSPNIPDNAKIEFKFTINGSLDISSLDSTDFAPDETIWNCPFILEIGDLDLYSVQYDDSTIDLSYGVIGNNSGSVNPGEEIAISMSFWNRLFDRQLNGLSAVLSCTHPQVNILRNTSYMGSVGARSIVGTSSPFLFLIPHDFVGDDIDFTVTITDNEGGQYVMNITTPVTDSYPPQVPGFPYNTGGAIRTSPKIVDLNNDGNTDIVVGNDNGTITAITPNIFGISVVPGWPRGAGSAIRNPLAIGDIDNSGTNSVVAVPQNGKLYAWHANGSPYGSGGLIVDLLSFGVTFKTPPVLVDINNDGALDIAVGATVNTATTSYGGLFVFDSDGTIIGNFSFPSTSSANPIVVAPAVGNIQGDDAPEIIVASQSGEVSGYLANGTRFFYQIVNSPINSPPVLGDIEGFGEIAIIIKATNGDVYAWHPDGTPIDGFPQSAGGSTITPIALGDIDNNVIPDIVVGSTNGLNFITAAGGTAMTLPQQITLGGGVYVDTQPSIADVDITGAPEILVSPNTGSMGAYDTDGTLIYNTPSQGFQYSTPAVSRIPNPNAVFIAGEPINTIIILASVGGSIYAFMTPYDSDPGMDHWPQYRHDPYNSGLYEPPFDTYLNAILWTTNEEPYTSTFDFNNDVDWLSFDGIANHLYRITITTPPGSTASPRISLYNPAVTKMSGPTSPQIEDRVSSNGKYYVEVTNNNSNYGLNATYQVTILDVTAITSIPAELWKDSLD